VSSRQKGEETLIKIIGLIAGIILPLWNIPLIYRIQKRRSSEDISLYWVFGVWTCFLLMFPSALLSEDIVFKAFSVMNLFLFTAVMVQAVRFRVKR
jgi:uncharacterized protein with PQ loop repeat